MKYFLIFKGIRSQILINNPIIDPITTTKTNVLNIFAFPLY